MCSDDDHIVYIDGKQESTGTFNVTSSTNVPSSATVIAIQVTNIKGPGGFKAAFSDNSVVSDDSWKCSPILTTNWQNVGFDDSLWLAPATNGTTTACDGFPSSAQWLWTDVDYNSEITIYCRKFLRKVTFCLRDAYNRSNP